VKEAEEVASLPSILFPDGEPAPRLRHDAPAFFDDLNLDQVLASLTEGREEYDLAPFYYTLLDSLDAIAYRHEILRDLEDETLFACLTSFAARMRHMRGDRVRAEKAYYVYEKEAWLLSAARLYGEAVEQLAADLALADLRSRALRAFRASLAVYVRSDEFSTLRADTAQVAEGLATTRYCVTIAGDRVTVSRCQEDSDYSAEVEQTFEKFQQGGVAGFTAKRSTSSGMNDVEARILDLVARLHPEVFSALDTFRVRHADYLDEGVAAFDRELQFYVAFLAYVARFAAVGRRFCYPQVSGDTNETHARDAFDVALATKLLALGQPVVCNDLSLSGPERIIVVSGPNQGGKTTFARMVGQLHYLAALGLLVPGTDARLMLCDGLYTHFEREEDLGTLKGKLEDDLSRIHDILRQATSRSVVIMNESLTGTTLQDASLLGRAVLQTMIARRILCVYVTFVDELASLSAATVSMVSTVVPDDPATRTYKVVRRPADGLAYAEAIAEKYGLTPERVKARLTS
jgi:hypothetical protein